MIGIPVLLSRLVLALSLIVYGPLATAMAIGNGVGPWMEICADGVVKTVQVNAPTSPSDSDDECCDCLTCWQSPATDGPSAPAGYRLTRIWTISENPSASSAVVLQTSNTRPLPRGPPELFDLQSTMRGPILTDRPSASSDMRSIGRPYCKDAVA